ncbi:MAG TPA: hypothetical protein PLC98_03590 [Anaerolineales bacterium]|nr:hypothetical protein [Anaerolineales bacterium]
MDLQPVAEVIVVAFEQYKPQVSAIVIAILVDLGLGLAAALKLKRFDLEKVAGFYRTSVLPNLVGWGTMTAALHVVTPEMVALFGPAAQWISPTISTGLLGAALIDLGVSIGKSVAELRGQISS